MKLVILAILAIVVIGLVVGCTMQPTQATRIAQAAVVVESTRTCPAGLKLTIRNNHPDEAWDIKTSAEDHWHLVPPGQSVSLNYPAYASPTLIVTVAMRSGEPDQVRTVATGCGKR